MEQFTIKLRPGMLAAIAMLWPLLVVVVYDLTGLTSWAPLPTRP